MVVALEPRDANTLFVDARAGELADVVIPVWRKVLVNELLIEASRGNRRARQDRSLRRERTVSGLKRIEWPRHGTCISSGP